MILGASCKFKLTKQARGLCLGVVVDAATNSKNSSHQ